LPLCMQQRGVIRALGVEETKKNDVSFASLFQDLILLSKLFINAPNRLLQELSYCKQLRTQYVEGIHRPKYYTVTLKSRLRVTQGH